jgi:hypothetical protein
MTPQVQARAILKEFGGNKDNAKKAVEIILKRKTPDRTHWQAVLKHIDTILPLCRSCGKSLSQNSLGGYCSKECLES